MPRSNMITRKESYEIKPMKESELNKNHKEAGETFTTKEMAVKESKNYPGSIVYPIWNYVNGIKPENKRITGYLVCKTARINDGKAIRD